MATVGVDLGSSSIRVCYSDPVKGIFKSESLGVETTITNRFISQSSHECFDKLVKILRQFPDDYASLSVTATCSMVVMSKVTRSGGDYLKSFSCDFEQRAFKNDILLWMDNRPTEQTAHLNYTLPKHVLDQLGGKVIPEMGLPKLKWLSDHYHQEHLVAFELHDWLSYLLMVGGFDEDGLVPYHHPTNIFTNESTALDGSIKGWSVDFLKDANIKIQVGQSEFQLSNRGSLHPICQPLGNLHESLGRKTVVVANGCIDCYAGWVTCIDPTSNLNNSLSMIAGTSTCFLLSTTKMVTPIPGVWGPFGQLLDSSTSLFEFGQSATGKLFERLFAQYEGVVQREWNIHNVLSDIGSIFQHLERETCLLEQKHSQSIHYIIRHYFYYGDVYGNRSPYNDHRMSESIIDGVNSSSNLDSVIETQTVLSLVIRYNLILEFLCFQIKQMVDLIKRSGHLDISSLTVCGSQAKNDRLMHILGDMLQIPLYRATDEDSKYNVVKGSSIIAAAGVSLASSQESSAQSALHQAVSAFSATALRPLGAKSVISSLSPEYPPSPSLMHAKYKVFLDMCERQRAYRSMIDAAVTSP